MSAFLELYGQGDTLADKMRTVARGTVVVDVVKGLLDEARESLKEAADAEQERTGTAFTARLDGVTALVTDPQPKPRVADQGAFAGWFAAAYPDDVQTVERVEVIDQGAAVRFLKLWHDPRGGIDSDVPDRIADALKVVTEVLLPEKALELAVDRARIHVTADACIDVVTGEHVPGLTVSQAKPVLQVRLEKAARAAATRQVRDVLGIPAELGGAS